jgi:hypothetical protein
MEHIQEKDPTSGKVVVRKIGMNPIQRDGMEYEFTTFIDVDQDHQCTSSKDRTSIVDGRVFQLNADLGTLLLQWLEAGVDAPEPSKEEPPINWASFWAGIKKLGFSQEEVHKIAGVESISDWNRDQLTQLTDTLKQLAKERQGK